ncbi:hypothetical protein P692DRAFT_20465982 [Suillus brevipes Sb2]|nr:hypothetical protein P692DRAFT_20465982 [Suillus brevipes Sb2]
METAGSQRNGSSNDQGSGLAKLLHSSWDHDNASGPFLEIQTSSRNLMLSSLSAGLMTKVAFGMILNSLSSGLVVACVLVNTLRPDRCSSTLSLFCGPFV